MRFLVDAQLPPRLAVWLAARGHDALHVGTLPDGLRLQDAAIWLKAASDDRIIVSKDKDFLDLAAVRGTPPLVLHLALGNCSTSGLLEQLEVAWTCVSDELASPDAGVVMIERGRLVVLRRL